MITALRTRCGPMGNCAARQAEVDRFQRAAGCAGRFSRRGVMNYGRVVDDEMGGDDEKKRRWVRREKRSTGPHVRLITDGLDLAMR